MGTQKSADTSTHAAYRNVEHLAKEKGVTLRTAALMRGIGRVKEAKHVRGVFP